MKYVFYKKLDVLRIDRKDFLAAYKSDRAKCHDDFIKIADVYCAEYHVKYDFDEDEIIYIAESLSREPSHSKGYVELSLAPICEETANNPCAFVGHCLNISVKSGRNDMKTLYTYAVPFNERT